MAQHAVYVVLGGTPRPLRLTLGSWAALEDQGHKLLTLLEQWQADPTAYRTLRLVLWAMLQQGDQRPTLDQVGDWVDAENLPTVLQAMGDCLRHSFPQENGRADPPMAAAGIGTQRAASPSDPSS
jgi:hypothetical protein